MKLITFLSLILLFSIPSFSQEEIEVDRIAQYSEGLNELYKRIGSEMNTTVLPRNISVKIALRFVVTKEGKVSNVEITRGSNECKECEIEALRVIRSLDNFKPALMHGKPVNSYYHLPISFVL